MTDIVDRILNENYTSDGAALDFSEAKLEASTFAGDGFEGSFHIYAPQDRPAEGYVVSTDLRMEVLSCEILGPDTEVFYRFHGEACEAGDVVKGVFSVISNMGEYYLPFVVTVERYYPVSGIGEIRDLFHFTNLAKSNWQEAVRLFYSEDFSRILTGSDQGMREAYRALSACPGNEQNVEEFLICSGKKQRLEILSGTESVRHILTEGAASAVQEKQIELIRNGWGYTYLEVECEGDFLFTEQQTLSDDDFLGNVCTLMIFLDTSLCGGGRHFGKVILKNGYTRLEIPVEVSAGTAKRELGVERSRRRILREITSKYVDYRLGILPEPNWLYQTEKLVAQMVSYDEDHLFARLCEAQLRIAQDRSNEAGWILDHCAELLDREIASRAPMYDLDLALCYHSYLTTLVLEDETERRESMHNVERLYRKNRGDWRIAWLYLQTFAQEMDLQDRFGMLEDYSRQGCISPVLFMEGVLCIRENAAVLQRPTEYVCRTIHYGIKKNLLGEEILEQVLILCGKNKESAPLLLRSMEALYGKVPDPRLLQEICILLIRAGKHDADSLPWYRLAVEQEVRITNLYEYYMMSLDLRGSEPVPKSVLLYFSLPSGLADEQRAYLYHYLIRNKREYAEIYAKNREAIETFVYSQIKKRRIGRHLAAVYYDVLEAKDLDRETSMALAELLFANWIETSDPKFVKAVVYQEGYREPAEYPLENGCGWAVIYGTSYTIVLEDAKGNRYLKSAEYTLEKMMLTGRFLHTVAGMVWDQTKLNLYLCGEEHGDSEPDSENVLRFQQLSESTEITPQKRISFILKTLEYLTEKGDGGEAQRLLSHADLSDADAEARRRLLPLLIRLDKYEKAAELLREHGPYFAEARDLQTLLDRLLPPIGAPEEELRRAEGAFSPEMKEILTFACTYVVGRGRRDGVLLSWLGRHFEGLSRDLRDIWRASGSYGLDRKPLEERMLVQMLFSGAFVGEQQEIFEDYAAAYPSSDVVRAFIMQSAYDYFVHEKLVGERIFAELEYLYEQGERLPRVADLAFLKYYSENPEQLTDEARQTVLTLLGEMMEARIHPGFFLDYLRTGAFPPGEMRQRLEDVLEEMIDKTIVDYRAREGNAARIHYMMASKNGEIQEYIAEYMTDIGYGVCFKEFILFFGESMQYYITEEGPDGQELTASGDLQKSDITGEGDRSRFGMIQDCLISNTLQDYGTLEKLLEEYGRREFIGKAFFRLK
ncbi:MAG: DUF5717 family protein [Lachnospiraceae bacterium]|nr:DUF5717 family protein [Lachnospiraceae bacterium]